MLSWEARKMTPVVAHGSMYFGVEGDVGGNTPFSMIKHPQNGGDCRMGVEWRLSAVD